MADNFKTQHAGGMRFLPQSTDPSNPKEGDIFRSDGTPRAAGLWEYLGGDWVRIAAQESKVLLKMQKTVAQNIPTNAFTPVNFDTTRIDTDTAFSGSTFTAPKDAYYELSAGVRFNTSAPWDQGETIQISFSGYTGANRTVKTAQVTNSSLAMNSIAVEDLVFLSTGDTVQVTCYQNSDDPDALSISSTDNWFIVKEV